MLLVKTLKEDSYIHEAAALEELLGGSPTPSIQSRTQKSDPEVIRAIQEERDLILTRIGMPPSSAVMKDSGPLFKKAMDGCFSSLDADMTTRFIDLASRMWKGIRFLCAVIDPNQDSLTKDDLLRFVSAALPESDDSLYQNFVVDRMFFGLDPLGTGLIAINNLVKSHLFLRFICIDADPPEVNPFHVANYQTLRANFLLQADGADFVQEDAFREVFNFHFSSTFVERVFESSLIDKEGCTFSVYVSILLMMNSLSTETAVRRIFPILDVDSDGYIGVEDIYFFYLGVAGENNEEHFKTLSTILLDTVGAHNSRVSLDDALQCGVFEEFVLPIVDELRFQMWLNDNSFGDAL